jgi:hypothetical protein
MEKFVLDDLEIKRLKMLGEGSAGRVYLYNDSALKYYHTAHLKRENYENKLAKLIELNKMNLDNYVLKEEGKSLIATSEIKRLAGLENYDDTEIRDELATKQSRLTAGDNIIIDENGVISAIGSGGSGTIQAYTVRYDAETQTVIFGKSFIAEEDATV